MSPIQLVEEIASLPANLQEELQQDIPLQKRQFGTAKGFFVMSDDFDEPLGEFKDYM